MASALAVITVGIDPTIEIGPFTLAWHGLTIAVGIVVGGLVAGGEARRRDLDTAPLQTIGVILVVAALVGSRAYYVAEHGDLLDPSEWLGTRGLTFYGGMIAAALGIGLYIWRRRLSIEYLDAVAFGLPLGIAIGRIGDLINGEHYGPATNFFSGCATRTRTRMSLAQTWRTTPAAWTSCCSARLRSPSCSHAAQAADAPQ